MHTRLWVCALPLAALMSAPVLAAPGTGYHKLNSISLPGNEGWDYLHLDARSRQLFISRGTHELVLNVDTNKIVGEIDNTQGVHGVAIASALNRGFTSNGKDDSVTIFDLKTLKKLDTVKVGKGPDAILYDRASKRVFTFNGGGNDITAVDAATGKAAGTIALGSRPEFAVADGRGKLYVNLEEKNEIAAIDTNDLSIKAEWSISPGENPSGIAMDRKNRRIFSVCRNQMMVVVDADTGKVIATPAIGNGPDAAAYDPGAHLAFSSNGRDGTLSIIQEVSPNQFNVVGTVPTSAGARTMALDSSTHRVYLITAKFQPAAPGQQPWRISIVPGSCEILVFGP
jgi:YVTN family beta-propeller protein